MADKFDMNNPQMAENDMENVELHRAESMANEHIEILDQIKDNEKKKKQSIHVNVWNTARYICSEIRQLKIEVIMFLYMFSYIARAITATTMIMEKVCTVHLGRTQEECDHLEDNIALKTLVEKMSNNYHLAHMFILMTPSAFLSIFIASWSDKYSRKIPISAALIGSIIDGLGTMLCAHFMKSRVEYYFIPALFTGFSGGFIGVLTILYSYASDVSSYSNRTMKYAFMEMAFGLSMPLGSLAGGWIFKYAGYIPVFLTSTCGHILGLFWVILVLEETRGLGCKESWREKFLNLWSFESFVASFRATMKKRPNRGRQQIWLLLVAMSIAVFNFASTAGITFFFVHHQFNWDNTTYSTISAIFAVMGIVLMMIIVPLCKKFKVGDAPLGIVGSISLMLKSIGTGLSFHPGIFFLANLAGLVSGLGSLAGRSRISKVISKQDMGKVFAFVTTAEAILPIAATAIVSQVFNATLEYFPGLIFVVMGVLIIIPLVIYVWLFRLPVANYEEMNQNLPEDDVPGRVLGRVLHPPIEAPIEK